MLFFWEGKVQIVTTKATDSFWDAPSPFSPALQKAIQEAFYFVLIQSGYICICMDDSRLSQFCSCLGATVFFSLTVKPSVDLNLWFWLEPSGTAIPAGISCACPNTSQFVSTVLILSDQTGGGRLITENIYQIMVLLTEYSVENWIILYTEI